MKTILITGATGTIGKAVAQALAERGHIHLILAGRSHDKLARVKKELNAKNVTVDALEVDLSNITSINQAINKVNTTYSALDALINVAAIYKAQRVLTPAGYEMMFATNHLGPFALTVGLLPLLKNTPGAKVLTVTAPSTTRIDFDNLNGEKIFSSFSFWRDENDESAFAFRLAKELNQGTQASIAFHPGLVKSDILNEAPTLLRGFFRLISSGPEKSAHAIASLIIDRNGVSQNGKFYNNKQKELKAAAQAYDDAVQQKLWNVSETLLPH